MSGGELSVPSPVLRADVACRAPWTALHFDQHGWVTACTANKRDALGNVATTTLGEIWNGLAAQTFRAAFDGGALAEGCDLCAWQRSHGGDPAMYARLYDGGDAAPDLVGPVHVEFAMSNRCNLACEMCNGALSSTIRQRRDALPPLPAAYPDRFYEELRTYTPTIARAKFLGGEPFLASENFRIWENWAEDGAAVSCHVTTNGTIWNRRVESILDILPMSFAVSLDGATAATVERIRAGADFSTVMANIDRFLAHADANGTDVSLTYCLMLDNWRELPDFLLLADELGAGAFVNTVLSPFRLSVYQLPASELAELVRTLEAESYRLEGLRRNRDVWTDQLTRLRAAIGGPAMTVETPVHFPSLDPPPLEAASAPDGAAQTEAALRAWSPVEPARFEVAADGVIIAIEPGHLEPLSVDRLLGAGIDELFIWLHAAFGRPDASAYLRHEPDLGDRLLRFADAAGATEVRVLSERRGDRARWLLATRRDGQERVGVT